MEWKNQNTLKRFGNSPPQSAGFWTPVFSHRFSTLWLHPIQKGLAVLRYNMTAMGVTCYTEVCCSWKHAYLQGVIYSSSAYFYDKQVVPTQLGVNTHVLALFTEVISVLSASKIPITKEFDIYQILLRVILIVILSKPNALHRHTYCKKGG